MERSSSFLHLKCLRARFVPFGIIYKSQRLSIRSLQYCVSMSGVWLTMLLLGLPAIGAARQLKLVNEWKTIDFNFPSEQLRQDAIARREFIPGMAVPIDVDVHYKGRKMIAWRLQKKSICVYRSTRLGVESFHDIPSIPRWDSNYFGDSVT